MTKKERVALISLIASLGLTGAKLTVGIMIGSLALITDALHSATDFVATLVSYFAVRWADRPADEDHPYGHGKFESIAALGEATLLLLLAGGVTVEAWNRLGEGAIPPAVGFLPFAVMGVEIVINAWRAHALNKTAKETGSRALASSALHFLSDVGSSIAVVIGLAATAYGYGGADPIAAMAVAVLIAGLALRMMKRTVDDLTDRVPPGLVNGLIRAVEDIPGVVTVNHVRVRHVGNQAFVDAAVEVPRSLAFEQIRSVKERINQAIAADVAGAEITVSCNPLAMDDETVRERVLLAAARDGLPIHHVTIQHLGNRIAISLDLEVDAEMPLGQAHRIASGLEEAIRAEIGAEVEVETHLEPLLPDLLPGETLTNGLSADILDALKSKAEALGVTDVHNVRVRELPDGLFVAFHCRFDGSLAAREVHARADALERAVRIQFPQIRRIVSHPEPTRA
jgi:cation diffusion facilitator family transporter